MSIATPVSRTSPQAKPVWARFMRWETLLALLFIIMMIGNALLSPYFLDFANLSDATANFSEQAIIALAMALLIIARDIDLSVAAIIAICSLAMGLLAAHGFGTPVLMLAALALGLACGMFNGWLVTAFALPSIVVTIGTMSLFRGFADVVLGDRALTHYPAALQAIGQNYVASFLPIPVSFAVFLVLACVFAFVLHATAFGRRLYAMGNNPVAARFSGIPVNRIRFILFALTGLMSGLAAILLTGRIGSTRPNIATGWELSVITMAILGGVSISGGSGTIGGVVLAVLLLGFTQFGLSLVNVPEIVINILQGVMLIVAIGVPRLVHRLRERN